MNLWCPRCNGTFFYYDKHGEKNVPDQQDTIVTDHMRCKNKSCNYEFNIEWFSFVREEWIRGMAESKAKFLKKIYVH